MPQLDDLLAVLDLERTGDTNWRGGSIVIGGGPVVFGGQPLAQTIVAAAAVDPAKAVKSVHTVFARGGSTDAPLDFDVDVMQQGRSFASATVSVTQGDRLCTCSLVLLHAPDPDLIRHQDTAPAVAAADDSAPSSQVAGFWEIRTVDGVDIADPDAVVRTARRVDPVPRRPRRPDAQPGAARLRHRRVPHRDGDAPPRRGRTVDGPPHDLDQRHHPHPHVPRPGGRLPMAPARPGEPGGRCRAQLRPGPRFTERGDLVASFVQENMIRAFAADQAPPAGGRAAH